MRIGNQRPRLQLLPEGVASSAADEAIALARTCGMELDDWQSWCLHWMLGERVDGSWAAPSSVLIVPRQAGKSALFEVIELAALYLFGEQRIIHTAHLAETSAGHMARMVSLIKENPDLEAITKFYFANGKERIERTDTGATIKFVTRSSKIGRGGSPQRVVFDEALFLRDEQMQALLPSLSAQSMNTAGGPQLIFGSSAPLPDSEVLHRVRKAGISGTLAGFFAEWSCDVGADIHDRENWYASNPGLGIRISEQWVAEQELPMMTPEAFAVERLGVVTDPDGAFTELPEWPACLDLQSELVGVPSVAVDVSPDLAWSSVAVAGGRVDGLSHVEVVDHLPGVGSTVDVLVALCAAHGVPVWVDPRSPAAGLLPELESRGVRVELVSTLDVVKACAHLKHQVAAGLVRHRGQGPLDAAVAGAAIRSVGDGWAWARRSSHVDISPLVAVTLALHGVSVADGPPLLFSY